MLLTACASGDSTVPASRRDGALTGAVTSTSGLPSSTSESEPEASVKPTVVASTTTARTTSTTERLADLDRLQASLRDSSAAGSMRYTVDLWASLQGAVSKRTILSGSFDADAGAGKGLSNSTLRAPNAEMLAELMAVLSRDERIDDNRGDDGRILASSSQPVVDYRHVDGTTWMLVREDELDWVELVVPVPLSPFELLSQVDSRLATATLRDPSASEATYDVVLAPLDMTWFGPLLTEFIEPDLYRIPSEAAMTGLIIVGSDGLISQISLDLSEWWTDSDPRLDDSLDPVAWIDVYLTGYGTAVDVDPPR